MRLRRLELAVLGLTLAFAVFMGGFFTGRSSNAVNPVAASLPGDRQGALTPAAGQLQASGGSGSEDAAAARTTQMPEQSGGVSQGTGAPKDSDGRININTATQGELTDLPGVGDAIALRIIDYRSQNGGFSNIEDIRNVSGIGERRYEAIKDFITVG